MKSGGGSLGNYIILCGWDSEDKSYVVCGEAFWAHVSFVESKIELKQP